LEIKGAAGVRPHHLRGLIAFGQEYKTKRSIAVSLDPQPRKVNGIEILPWKIFLDQLWAGRIIHGAA
ncbi:MAG: AAA family ATPase, partial [Elusimicrobia bacterium]|nr:AAA family ATPase [Elusimicrobiota bacterium]